VVAGPGAGKTELLAQRACFLLEAGICPTPFRILAISFKRDAAKNLQERVRKRCGDRAQRFDSFTLDAFAKSLVDRFLPALPDGWRPKHGYEVLTKSMREEEKRQWLIAAGVPKGHPPINLNGQSRSEIGHMFDSMSHGQVLPYDSSQVSELERYWGVRWWREQLDRPAGSPSLTFPMLNRLAAFLLRSNSTLLRALQATYSFVFLDEFQDTTAAQYDLVEAAFLGSGVVMTAVGDSKQRIMLWAGAMHNVFDVFKGNFDAEYVHLFSNYRSAPELVHMQHVIAQILEEGTPAAVAAKTDFSGSCVLIEFSNPEDEAGHLAEMIESGIRDEGKNPRDFCILVRQLAGNMIQKLKPALADRDIKIRDESQLQDLLSEPVVKFLLAVLRLATRPRDPEAWETLATEIASLFCLDENEEGVLIEQEAHRLLQHAKGTIAGGQAIDVLPQELINIIGEMKFRSVYRQYAHGSYLKTTIDGLAEALRASAEISASARETVDDVIGVNVVPAMTIHKSKGLEFHTVIFMGLEDSQWWNFANQADEEKRGFFVAFSRAIEHVYFTFSDVRDGRWGRRQQDRGQISDLYAVLQKAGVPTEDCRRKG
jgi:superfamily I DNA/RNA helicase